MRRDNELVASFLRERSPLCEHIQLERHGITGNGHMLMGETNSDEIIDLIVSWLVGNVLDDVGKVPF